MAPLSVIPYLDTEEEERARGTRYKMIWVGAMVSGRCLFRLCPPLFDALGCDMVCGPQKNAIGINVLTSRNDNGPYSKRASVA